MLVRNRNSGEILQHGLDRSLHRMRGIGVAAMIDSERARGADESRMLSGAVVVQSVGASAAPRKRLRRSRVARPVHPAAERGRVEPGCGEHPFDDCDMPRLAAVRSAGKRECFFREIEPLGGARLHQYERLHRFDGRARIDERIDVT
jgi:hypothetical protein